MNTNNSWIRLSFDMKNNADYPRVFVLVDNIIPC